MSSTAANRPHIVLIMTDQQKASATSIYGNRHVSTPTWERLASQGVTFDRAYSQSAICTPSRASMMTGTYPLVHRVFCHQNHAPANLAQLPEFLSDASYHTVAAGHYEEIRKLDRGWHDAIDIKGTPALAAALKAQYDCGSRTVGWTAGESSVGPDKAHAAVLNDELFATLDRIDPTDKPLFLHVAYIEPHPPYFAPRGFLDEDAVRDVPLPQLAPDPATQPRWHAEMLRDYGSATATEPDMRRCLAAYYGMIRYVDSQIDRLLHYLDRRGILDNAWVILTSDHGDYTGEKGFYTKSEAAYDCLLHVPLVIRGPHGQWHAGQRCADIVELLDLFPTVLSAAGARVPEQSQGHDLLAWMDAPNRAPLRDASFSAVGAYHGHLKTTMPWGLPHSGRRKNIVRGARGLTHSYIRDPDTGDEAYDLTRDPLELHNLLQDAQPMPPAVAALSQSMDRWEKRCEDLFNHLGVQPGDRNFDEPLPATVNASK